jgi:transposase InsO family protein
MKVHGLLLQRDGEQREERHRDGRVAVDRRNTRWCSDALEIGCDNGEKVRVAFALDCCGREAMGHVATTAGITAADVQDRRAPLRVREPLAQAGRDAVAESSATCQSQAMASR